MSNEMNEIKRLNFENLLWIVFGILCFMNVYGDELEKEYVYTHSNVYEKDSNDVFTFTLFVTFFIYIYFFLRNSNSYKKASLEDKSLYQVKVLGSIFLIAGIICLIYFQMNNENFIGSPSL